LSGRVVDESNQGVAGVDVSLNSGQSAVTDNQGNYVFGSVKPGTYTVTPFHLHNPFQPGNLSVTLTTDNVTLPTLTMKKPIFDIVGKVLNPNGSPLAGIKVQLNGKTSQTTGADGSFTFAGQQVGSYTVKPIAPDLHFMPAERSVRAEDELAQLFYAVAQPVTHAINPNKDTVVTFNDTQGLPTTITFPQGLGPGQATITPLMIGQPDGYLQAGHTIDIELSDSNASAQSIVTGQNGQPLALEIKIKYNKADLQSMLNAKELALFWQSPDDGWVDAQATCPAGNSADLNTSEKTLTMAVCQYGIYGLFAPVSQVFMPSLYAGQ
jgi:hypothetical protein